MFNQLKSKVAFGLILYFFLWMIFPYFLSASYPLDVPEGIYWGREWEWGYYKHPPLSSWLLFSFYHILGLIGPYVLSQITIGLTLWILYCFSKNFLNKEKAYVGSLLTLGIFYYTFPSLEFNHNIAQMPLWAGLIYSFYLATRKNTWKSWLCFGALAGIGMLVKYTVAILLCVMVLYSFITAYRTLWLTAKPWVALLIACAIFAPNVIWLIQHDWLPFTYAEARAAEAETKNGRLSSFSFLLTQFLNHLPLLFILLGAKLHKKLQLPKITLNNDQFYLVYMGIFPSLFLAMMSLITGIGLRDMWGMPMWSMSALILVSLIPDTVFEKTKKQLLKGLMIWLIFITVLTALYVQFGAEIRHKPSRMDWEQKTLALNVDEVWQQNSKCKLDSITGNDWLNVLVAASSKYSPSVMVSNDAQYSPWMTAQRLQQHGTAIIWIEDQMPQVPYLDILDNDQHLIVKEGEWLISWKKMTDRPPLRVHWRIYVPQTCLKH